ncbi:DMT family transporter [Rhodohalobacter sp. SW132]|uniref:DMT family transporter n=1 Tax=Rhodohalobacter sp. SW132 TaxID=2293433 RepID=UPI001F1718D5|nr:DMT family transporter [Rhodohalobacter sp. SW132]
MAATEEAPLGKIILLLFVGLFTFGLAPILVRYATDIEPMALAALRTGFAVLCLLPFWLPKRESLSTLQSKGINHFLLVFAGISLGLHFSFWIASLHYTSVASASVLVTMHPVMLIVAERFIFGKNFKPIVWCGVFLSFTGSLLLGVADDASLTEFPDALLGNAFAFTAAVIFVVYFMLGRKIRQYTEWIDYVFYVYLYATLTCVILTIIWVGGLPYLSGTALIIGLALAVGPTILGHGSMNYAVKYVSPTLLSTLVLSEVIFAALLAYLFFNEIPTLFSMGAMVVIMIGVSFTWYRRVKKPTKPTG